MPAIIFEQQGSRATTVSADSPSVDLNFQIMYTEDDSEVRALVEAEIPAFYAGLPFQAYQISPQGCGVWEAVAHYGKNEPPTVNTIKFSFDTSGATTHITQSLSTVAKHGVGVLEAPDCKGAIGVNGDQIDGTDITIPQYSFTIVRSVPVAELTLAYRTVLLKLTGKVNNEVFYGCGAGEALFLGASGTVEGDPVDITYKFSGSENVTGMAIGDISGIDKKGWEYLWVKYADVESADALVKQPSAVYVEKVYESGDFSLLGLGDGT